MPMLYARRDIDAVSWKHFYGFFAFFLVIAAACHAHQNLPSTCSSMVNVPIVATSGFKGDIKNAYLAGRNRRQIALPYKVL